METIRPEMLSCLRFLGFLRCIIIRKHKEYIAKHIVFEDTTDIDLVKGINYRTVEKDGGQQ